MEPASTRLLDKKQQAAENKRLERGYSVLQSIILIWIAGFEHSSRSQKYYCCKSSATVQCKVVNARGEDSLRSNAIPKIPSFLPRRFNKKGLLLLKNEEEAYAYALFCSSLNFAASSGCCCSLCLVRSSTELNVAPQNLHVTFPVSCCAMITRASYRIYGELSQSNPSSSCR
jgi:hypothetical protein